ncbi:MAG: SDR family NAD(P)-dependent oxidoreductase [Gammaproteobacteria bacterium]
MERNMYGVINDHLDDPDLEDKSGLGNAVAIIGMGCRFPGSVNNPEDFWNLMVGGRDAIVEVPPNRWDIRQFYDPDSNQPGKMYVKCGGFLSQDINAFDALFFGITPREAECMDPQQRLLLEVAWESLEDAGIVHDSLSGSDTGVYIGAFTLDNKLTQMGGANRDQIGPHTAVGSTMTILSNRLSYVLDLRGPSISVDTACSSSMVAFHYACEAIRKGDCSLALAGGVNVIHRPEYMIAMCKGHFLAPDGHCKSFDARADGYGRGEGAGVLVLKSLSRALRDGDRIHAIVRGTGVNQDGRTSGITVPNGDAQEKLVLEVCEKAGVHPHEIGYVEAHGTGTPIGDPTEAGALGRALGNGRPQERPLLLSSVKANIGHLEAASGVAGIIKTTLCLKHGLIPPLANLVEPNPEIPFAELGLRLPTEIQPMPKLQEKTYAAINSFGYGGTNAHALLERAPEPASGRKTANESGHGLWILPLSARSDKALKSVAKQIRDFVAGTPDIDLNDLGYTAAVRRNHYNHRLAVFFSSRKQLLEQLQLFIDGQHSDYYVTGKAAAGEEAAEPAFVFTGMGPQWWAMGRELLNKNPVFRKTVEECDRVLKAEACWSILEELTRDQADSRITETAIAQPANFVIQTGLLEVFKSWGIQPASIVGHSVGEVTAAYASGMLSLEDAVKVSCHRARIQAKAAGRGKMLAVGLTEEAALSRIAGFKDKVSIAAVNSYSSITLAGDGEALEAIAAELESEDIFNRFLKVEVPYHSPAMEPLKPELRASLASVRPVPAVHTVYSTVTAKRVEDSCFDAEYWCDNVREPVYFAKTLEAMVGDGLRIFLEIGPHPVLSTSIKETLMRTGVKAPVISTLWREEPEALNLLAALGGLYVAGSPIEWGRFYSGGLFLDLPHYPWERQSYWSETDHALTERLGQDNHPLLYSRVAAPQPIWESRLNRGMLRYLDDHVVDGVVVLPGAAYIEAALALSGNRDPGTRHTLTDLEFHKALVIDELDEPVLRVEQADQGRFEILSRTRDLSKPWTRHATGRIWAGEQPQPPSISVTAVTRGCVEDLPTDVFYRNLKQRGLQYGPWFQGVQDLKKDDHQILARINAHSDYISESEKYRLHPTLLDACFQALIGLLGDADNHSYLPVRIDRISLYQRPGAQFWMHGTLTLKSRSAIIGDLTLFDDDGCCIAEIAGLKCQALVSGEQAIDKIAEKWLYQYEWKESPLEVDNQRTGNWLVYHSGDNSSSAIVARLSQAIKGLVVQASADERYRFTAPDRAYLDPDRAEDFRRLLKDGPTIENIAFICDPDQGADDMGTLVSRQALRLLNLLNAASAHDSEIKPRVYVITRGAQSVLETDRLINPAQWGQIGLSRVAHNEYRDLYCTLVDIRRETKADEIMALVDELVSDAIDDDVALRGSHRFTHSLQRSSWDTLKQAAPKRVSQMVSSNRSYQVVCEQNGVYLKDFVRKTPACNEIEIAIRSVTVNEADQSPGDAAASDHGLRGYSGVVSRVGDGVFGFSPGDAVVGCETIALRSFENIKADSFISRIPSRIDLSTAPVIAKVYAPLMYSLTHLALIRSTDAVMLHGLRARYALAAARLVKALGAKVIIASTETVDESLIETLDICGTVKPSLLDFQSRVELLTGGRGIDILLDFAGSAFTPALHASVAPFGRILTFHGTSHGVAIKDPRNISYMQINVPELIQKRHELCPELCVELFKLIEQGALDIRDVLRFSCNQLNQAFAPREPAQGFETRLLTFRDHPCVSIYPAVKCPDFISDSGSYLITGGFGGFGARIAHWLVDHGARYLVLVGRRGASSREKRNLIRDLRNKGAQILSIRADVTRLKHVERIMRKIKSNSAPPFAVLHAAAELDDAPLAELDFRRLKNAIHAKVQGAWNLHTATRNTALKHFVLFSSVSSVIGNSRQGNYVSANTFLDNLAQYRRDMRLPGLSINWGAIGDAGMAAESSEVEKHLAMMGMRAFTADHAMQAFEHASGYQPVQLGILDIDWYRWSQYEPAGGASSRFRHLVEAESVGHAAAGGDSLREELASMDSAARREMLILILSEQISETLRLPQDNFDPQRPLTEMGIDSLLGVELQTGLNISLGIELSALELIKGNNTEQIAEIILRKFNFDAAPQPERKAVPAAPKPEFEDVDAMDDEALDELIQKLADGVRP